jgi:hypothetical protein
LYDSTTHPCHYRDKEEEKTSPVSIHILFREFNADSEHADGNDNASELEGQVIGGLFGIAP